MLDAKTFFSVPNWLDVEGRRLPVIVSGRKPACWHCGEIGHLSAVCPKIFLNLVTEGSVTTEAGSVFQYFITPPKIPKRCFGGGFDLNQLSLKSNRFLTHELQHLAYHPKTTCQQNASMTNCEYCSICHNSIKLVNILHTRNYLEQSHILRTSVPIVDLCISFLTSYNNLAGEFKGNVIREFEPGYTRFQNKINQPLSNE